MNVDQQGFVNPGQYPQTAPQQQPQPYNPQSYAPSGYAAAQPQLHGPTLQGPDQEGLLPNLSPLGFIAGSSFLSGGQNWGQQYVQRVQQRMSWLSGSAFNYHFAVNNTYVSSKLLMLLAPFLKKWTYTRQPEQVQGVHKFRPPRVDVNAPDMYLPLMSLWTYVIAVCAANLLHHKFKPDLIYSTAWSASMSWIVHAAVAYIVLRAMNLPTSVPWVELFSYTGYTYVHAVITIVAGQVGGKWAYYLVWVYGGLCMAIFLVRTMKRILFQEARNYGRDLSTTNYLLLTLAAFQFPLLFWLTNIPLPAYIHVARGSVPAASPAGTGALKIPVVVGKSPVS